MKTKFIPQVEAVYDIACPTKDHPNLWVCQQRVFPNVIHAMEFFRIPLRYLKHYRLNDNYLAYRSAKIRSGRIVKHLEIMSM